MLPHTIHVYHVCKFRSTRVVWLLGELAQLYRRSDAAGPRAAPFPNVVIQEWTDVPAFREHKPEWFLALNPNGKIPVLVEVEGAEERPAKVMIEGGAICLSLLDRYDVERKLLPPDQQSLFYQLAFYCAGTVDNLTATSSPIQRAVRAHAGKGEAANLNPTVDPVRKTAWDEVIAPFLEAHIAATPGDYFGGNAFSAVDLFVGMSLFAQHERMIARGDGTSWIREERTPRLHRLAALLAARPARAFAFSATLNDPTTLAAKTDFGVQEWVAAGPPRHAG